MTMSNANQCMNCGLCNTVDPILTAVKKESASSRFKVVLAKQEKTSPLFYLATDASMQEAVCPAGVKFNEIFRLMREKNLAEGIVTQANQQMAANFKKFGSPYANQDHEDYHDKPVW